MDRGRTRALPALIRTRAPALRTLPSRTCETPSRAATSATPTLLPLKVKAVLRDTTERAETFDRSVMMSSLMPSEKYACSASPLMLANGSTQMLARRAAVGPFARDAVGPASS
ncbi:MAG: hypothetical protein ACYC8V_01305 [Caulobacteraceae bacterium]